MVRIVIEYVEKSDEIERVVVIDKDKFIVEVTLPTFEQYILSEICERIIDAYNRSFEK